MASNRMLERYLDLLFAHRIAFILIPVVVIAAMVAGATRLSVSSDFDIYFSDDNPQLAAYERFERIFTAQENLSFLVLPDDGDVLDPQSLALIGELTEAGWRLPYARRSSSLTNHPYTVAEDDFLATDDLVPDPAAVTLDQLGRVRARIHREPDLLRSLVAPDLSAAVVNVSLVLPEDARSGNEASVSAARRVRDELRDRYPEHRVLLGGSAPTNVTLTEAVTEDVARLVTLSYTVIIIGLALLLRSVVGTAGTLAVITLSITGTLGLFGWLGYTLSPVTGFVPSIVMTVAVADSVHLLVTWFHERRAGSDPTDAMREAIRVNAQPIFLTSLTTIIGVLSLNLSDSPPYRDLGNMIAVGVALAWLLTMSVLPAALSLHPGRAARPVSGGEHPMDRYAGWVVRHRLALLIVVGAGTLLVGSQIVRNELTERWHQYFGGSFEVRQAMDASNDHIGAIHAMQYILDAGEPDGINDPEYLSQVDAFGDWLREQPGVNLVGSLADTVSHLNRIYHDDDPSYDRIPDDRELTAQYLLLYELSLPAGMGLDSTINVDRSASRLAVTLSRTDSESLLELERRAQDWLRENAPAIQPTEATGLDMMFSHINHRNIRGILSGTAIALVLISILLVFALRSVKLGMISLVPNLAPAIIAYGIWGMLVGHIDLALSIVSAMSLGIVVDDTVHFMSKYRRAVVEKGMDAIAGVRYAFRTVGVALIITTAVLVAGFSILGFSGFNPTRETGTLLAVTLAVALVVDFLLLPPLLIFTARDGGRATTAANSGGIPET